MKILRVIPTMNPKKGGPSQGIRNSIPEMKKNGIVNEVVCLDNIDSDYLKNEDYIFHALGAAENKWAYNKNLIPWLSENIHRFDVIVIHGLWLYHGYATHKVWGIFKENNSKYPKLFMMPHGMLDPYFQKSPERRLKAFRNIIYWKLIESKIVNNVDGLLFTCDEELLLAKKSFRSYKPFKELNVGYGIQRPPFNTEEMLKAFSKHVSEWDGKPFLLFLSRIHEKKGLDMLIQAYLILEKKHDNLPQLIIAGPLDSDYANSMKELARKSENILFSGMLKDDAKWGAFYNCETFILPSHQENFGIAIVEAMACGKSVLITDKVNIWREIEKGCGGLISDDTYEGVNEMLSKWLGFSDVRKKEFANNAKETYKNNFTVEIAAKNFLSAIQK